MDQLRASLQHGMGAGPIHDAKRQLQRALLGLPLQQQQQQLPTGVVAAGAGAAAAGAAGVQGGGNAGAGRRTGRGRGPGGGGGSGMGRNAELAAGSMRREGSSGVLDRWADGVGAWS